VADKIALAIIFDYKFSSREKTIARALMSPGADKNT